MKAARLFHTQFLVLFTFILLSLVGSAGTAHAQTATTTVLQQSSACPTSGCVTTLTATVTASGTAVHPGLVVFCDGSTANCESGLTLGHAQLLTNGTATLKLTLKTGSHTLRAIFHGTKTYASSTSATQSLTLAPTAAQRVTSMPQVQANAFEGGYSFSVPYISSISPIAPTGTVSFVDTSRNNTVLATATVGSPSTSYGGFTYVSEDVSLVPSASLTSAVAAISGDFNNDGIEDVAEMDANAVLTVLLGNGNGGFLPAPAYNGNTGGHGPMLVGDFNGDGKLDIAIPDAATRTVHVALGNGDGTFTFASPTALTDSPQFLSLADVNGDGIPDLVALSGVAPGTSVHVLLGAGNGTFTPLAPITFSGDIVKSVVVADFNHDGNQDLAVADSTASKILVLNGIGDGTFNATPAASISHQARYLAAGDFDGDGIPDLASGTDTLAFFHGNGNSTFTQQGIEVNNVQFLGPITTGGYNGSGTLEVGYLPGPLAFYDFPFAPSYQSFANYDAFIYSQEAFSAAAIGDFNGSGLVNVLGLDTSQAKVTDYSIFLSSGSSAPSYRKLTFDAGNHTIVATYGGDAAHDSSSATTAVFGSVIDYGSGFTASPAASINGSASIQGTALQLKDDKPFESSSFFNTTRLPWAGFQSSFDFQLGSGVGDGFAFVVQSNGPDAIGSSGGGLGYGNPPGGIGDSITNSFAVVFDTHNNQGEGSNSIRIENNGVTSAYGAIDLTPYGIDLHSGHRFNVVMTDYTNPKYISLLIADLTTKKSANIGLQGISQSTIGDMAYVGFTAGSGATSAIQTIFDWTFTLQRPPLQPQPYPPPAFSTGFAGTTALTFNGGSAINGTALQLTNGTTYQSTSTYFTKKLGPGYGFSTDFDFDLGTGAGDGFTFVIQNGHISALGSSGGGLGYGPDRPGGAGYSIPDSTAIKFDLHDNAGEGINSTGIYINGASPTTPAVDITPSGVNLHSGHIFHAHIAYTPETSVITLTITDLTVYHVFETTFAASSNSLKTLPLAFVGFTAGTGATLGSIKVLNWTFTNVDPL
jgi:hypothetical protein